MTSGGDTTLHATDYNPANALRETPADIQYAAGWSKQNNFRIDMLFNGGGSVACANGSGLVGTGDTGGGVGGSSSGGIASCTGPTDPLLAAFQANDSATSKPYTQDFGWISHTWDHPNVDEGCATQNYIAAELNQNSEWGLKAPGAAGNPSGGLGLTSSNAQTGGYGTLDPAAVVTGEHSGLANLIPGNPGQVDPPSLDAAAPVATGGTLAAGSYVYAVTDKFNTAAPGATPTVGDGGVRRIGVLAGRGDWDDELGHARLGGRVPRGRVRDYRALTAPVAPATVGSIGAWTKLGSVPADTTTDFTDPASTTDTTGGGSVQKTFTDAGAAGTPTGSSGAPTSTSVPADVGNAVESAYEQNPSLNAAFSATEGGGIKYFGSDASKPYPSPADQAFGTGLRRREVPRTPFGDINGRARGDPALPDEHLLQRRHRCPGGRRVHDALRPSDM